MKTPELALDVPASFAAAHGSASLSPTMAALRSWIAERGGIITRFPGGFWTVEPWGQKTWGTSSIEALVRRGVLEYCEWKENRNGRFPIRARMTQNAEASEPGAIKKD